MSADGIKAGDRQAGDRLYRKLAQRLFDEIVAGKYKIGERLPAERELAAEHDVSRPVAREALIALEVQGFIEVRLGSGAYVCRIPGDDEQPGFAITAFELTEARLLFEGEAAALAALHITDAELNALEQLVEAMRQENAQPEVTEMADREFHFTIARATRNVGVSLTIEELWRLRSTSPECALLHYRARSAKVRPVVEEHVEILTALRTHDPVAARVAMRAHLSAVMEHLLFTTEEHAVEEARRTVATVRKRYSTAIP